MCVVGKINNIEKSSRRAHGEWENNGDTQSKLNGNDSTENCKQQKQELQNYNRNPEKSHTNLPGNF